MVKIQRTNVWDKMYFMKYSVDIIRTFSLTEHQNNKITEVFFT